MERVEANLDRFATMLVQTAERQSLTEHTLQLLGEKVDKIATATAADGEHIRALVRIAEAHQRRIEDLEQKIRTVCSNTKSPGASGRTNQPAP